MTQVVDATEVGWVLNRFCARVGSTPAHRRVSAALGSTAGLTIGCAGAPATGSLARAGVLFTIVLTALAGCTDPALAPGDPATNEPVLRVVRGNAQISAAGSDLAAPLVVRVTNRRGRPLAGERVEWSADAGLLEPERLVSDDSGLVRAGWTLGAQVGRYSATASLGNRQVMFRATAVAPLTLGAPRRLALVTFDGSGQLVHPDVAPTPRGWAPARRFLAITPYPGGDSHKELPSVYASGASSEWVAPDGLRNPVVRPWKGYLSDPDLVYVPDRRELWMYYRHVSKRNSVFLTVSPDGSHWSRPVRLLSGPNHTVVSPAVVRVAAGDWHMWAVNAGASGCMAQTTTVEHRTSEDGLHWSPPQTVQVSAPDGLPPWHIDVVWVKEWGEFWALYNEKPELSCATPALRLATSPDGVNWTARPAPVLESGDIAEFRDIVYRSTLEYDPRTDMVTLWYSGARASGEGWVWSAAVERRSRRDLFRIVDAPVPAPRRFASPRARPVLLSAP